MDWQPISTAPRNGQPVLVGCIVGVRVTWWHKATPGQVGKMWEMKGGYCDPTHWFPLPLQVPTSAISPPVHADVDIYCTDCENLEAECICQGGAA